MYNTSDHFVKVLIFVWMGTFTEDERYVVYKEIVNRSKKEKSIDKKNKQTNEKLLISRETGP